MARTILSSYHKKFIREHYRIYSAQLIADRFDISPVAVRRYIKDQGFVLTREDRFNIHSNSVSTATRREDNYIIKNYLKYPVKTLADHLDRSDVFIKTRLDVLGLVIPPEIIQQRKEMARFKPGTVPANKGKKMSRRQYKLASPTMFKKGNVPANTLFDGAITIRKDTRGVPQKYIRLKKGKWEYLSRYNYREHIGPIPPRMLVAFKDKDTLNCDPSNLFLISQADNARRNSDSKYPAPVREVIRLNNKLKKAVHAKKRNRRSA